MSFTISIRLFWIPALYPLATDPGQRAYLRGGGGCTVVLYFIFAKKQRIKFFDLPDWAKFFTLILLESGSQYSFARDWVQNRFLPRWHTLILFRLLGTFFFNVVGTSSIIHYKKMYLIWSKECADYFVVNNS